jgi:hypothetical protein|tara:strand:- start:733 stop:894 length:162 start_codon:yes stop_codon:yes gene_type:complete
MTKAKELHAQAQRAYIERLKSEGYRRKTVFVKPEGLKAFAGAIKKLREQGFIV